MILSAKDKVLLRIVKQAVKEQLCIQNDMDDILSDVTIKGMAEFYPDLWPGYHAEEYAQDHLGMSDAEIAEMDYVSDQWDEVETKYDKALDAWNAQSSQIAKDIKALLNRLTA